MKISIDLFSLILPYLNIKNLCNVDSAFLNKHYRPIFLKLLQNQKVLTVEGNLFLLDKHGFIKWLKTKKILFERILFFNATNFLFNSIICLHQESIRYVEIDKAHGRISKESLSMMSLLCPNIKSFKFDNKPLIEDNIDIDFFYDLHPEFLVNLEYLHLNRCSNYAILLLTLYANKLKYIKIDELSRINPGIIYDLVAVKHRTCHIESDLIWSVKTNLLLIKQRKPGSVINIIHFNYDDINFLSVQKIKHMFTDHKSVNKLVLNNVDDAKGCVHIFENVDNIENLVINGMNTINLDALIEVVQSKKINTVKIIYSPTLIDICISNLIIFFQKIFESSSKITINNLYLNIDFTENLVEGEMIFENYIKLVNYIEKVILSGKIKIFKFNHKIVTMNANWKNDIYYHFLF